MSVATVRRCPEVEVIGGRVSVGLAAWLVDERSLRVNGVEVVKVGPRLHDPSGPVWVWAKGVCVAFPIALEPKRVFARRELALEALRGVIGDARAALEERAAEVARELGTIRAAAIAAERSGAL